MAAVSAEAALGGRRQPVNRRTAEVEQQRLPAAPSGRRRSASLFADGGDKIVIGLKKLNE